MTRSANLNHYFIAALVIFFVGLMVWFFFYVPTVKGIAHIQVGGSSIEVEIADTPLAHAKGLSGRASLPENHGMLFVFAKPEIHKFWMGGMRFPLDIIWINGDIVVEVATLKSPTTEAPIPETWTSESPVDKVLELNAGMAEKLGIKAGSRIKVER